VFKFAAALGALTNARRASPSPSHSVFPIFLFLRFVTSSPAVICTPCYGIRRRGRERDIFSTSSTSYHCQVSRRLIFAAVAAARVNLGHRAYRAYCPLSVHTHELLVIFLIPWFSCLRIQGKG